MVLYLQSEGPRKTLFCPFVVDLMRYWLVWWNVSNQSCLFDPLEHSALGLPKYEMAVCTSAFPISSDAWRVDSELLTCKMEALSHSEVSFLSWVRGNLSTSCFLVWNAWKISELVWVQTELNYILTEFLKSGLWKHGYVTSLFQLVGGHYNYRALFRFWLNFAALECAHLLQGSYREEVADSVTLPLDNSIGKYPLMLSISL